MKLIDIYSDEQQEAYLLRCIENATHILIEDICGDKEAYKFTLYEGEYSHERALRLETLEGNFEKYIPLCTIGDFNPSDNSFRGTSEWYQFVA